MILKIIPLFCIFVISLYGKDLSGKITLESIYSYNGKSPHDKFTSLKSTLFLDYAHKFKNEMKFKFNLNLYYDAIYNIKSNLFYREELSEMQKELELFEAYFEGDINNDLSFKIGRQVVVWGNNDNIRITDILNPLDSRQPGITDIQNIYLPLTMIKLNYFLDGWTVTPIAIVEQRFSKNPVYGSEFYTSPIKLPNDEEYKGFSYALSLDSTFSDIWDISFYVSKLRNDAGYKPVNKEIFKHDKLFMLGMSLNFSTYFWIFRTEVAYFKDLKYTQTQEKTFNRIDALIGLDYGGISDTMLNYDFSIRHIDNYDNNLLDGFNLVKRNTYQHALKVTSNFVNSTIKTEYLLSLFGVRLNNGGFQRVSMGYNYSDNIDITIGAVDYIGGSNSFDFIKNNDMLFIDISYSF